MIVIRKDDKVAYYNQCKNCGANLDPGETCDCVREKRVKEYSTPISLIEYEKRVMKENTRLIKN